MLERAGNMAIVLGSTASGQHVMDSGTRALHGNDPGPRGSVMFAYSNADVSIPEAEKAALKVKEGRPSQRRRSPLSEANRCARGATDGVACRHLLLRS